MKTAFFLLLLLFGANALACEFESIAFTTDMPAGRLDHCEKVTDTHYRLFFKPEDDPINPSPWFYFKVRGEHAAAINLTLDFGDFSPRYLPKISADGHRWDFLPFDTRKNTMQVTVNVEPEGAFIAAQEPIVHRDYDEWLSDVAKQKNTEVTVLGQSLEGRDIQQVALDNNTKQWLVIVGRQHPPEVTGALALRAFVDEMLRSSDLSEKFFARFNLLLIPELNPDGVARGNWRHSAGHVDLNRDWKAFSQPETRLVRDSLDSLSQHGDNIAIAIDFHSTFYDVFYTIPADAGVTPPTLVEKWLAALDESTQRLFRPTEKPGNSPDKGVFKQFIADRYGAHGVTYEVGDNTPRDKIDYVAKQAARTLMNVMLTYPDNDYAKRATTTKQENTHE